MAVPDRPDPDDIIASAWGQWVHDGLIAVTGKARALGWFAGNKTWSAGRTSITAAQLGLTSIDGVIASVSARVATVQPYQGMYTPSVELIGVQWNYSGGWGAPVDLTGSIFTMVIGWQGANPVLPTMLPALDDDELEAEAKPA